MGTEERGSVAFLFLLILCALSHCPKKVTKPEEVRSRRPEPNTEGKGTRRERTKEAMMKGGRSLPMGD